MALEVIDLTPVTGSEVRVDLATLLAPETGKELRRLLVQRGVLVFRGANLTDEQQVQLAGNMGNIRDEGKDGVFKVTLDKRENAGAEYLKGSFLWHMDGTHDQVPVFASLLSGRKLSQEGGQTMFANSYAAYEALREEMKRKIENLHAVHSLGMSMTRAGVEATDEDRARWHMAPDRTHKLVWPHANGRKSLVIGCHASHIAEMDRQEGEELIEDLIAWTTQPRFVYVHEWTPGDLLIWDNTGVLHRVEPYPMDSGRMMHRTTLLGEEAFA
ncbi:TauD/TfdA family dioxygenase [Novosphingobium sp. 9U]|uniref:TauD/TfdA dioxygenase family protein n=1 Tax=Novosphingobium sp. 9U TaxID=2653158 RepID=UPI0012F18C81|nr:TauD/TfdA family dioxygenase [Novosphingobium sp. 9U]VWX47269.1 putative (S)-phenoxypropionate/alpha-ketoglutarate-dioxygenase [Novosphingobium sp. 9U]